MPHVTIVHFQTLSILKWLVPHWPVSNECHVLHIYQCVSLWCFALTPLICYYCVVAESLLGHRVSPSFIDVCCVLPCSILPISPSFFSLLLPPPAICLGYLHLGPFCVFSCACPSPSRSEHRGAHPDPSGGEAPEDQSPTPAGGRQRYAAGPKDPVSGKGLVGPPCWLYKAQGVI